MTHLSPRQREIVVLVGRDDKSWKAVARELGLHLSTVRNHVEAIKERYGSTRNPRSLLTELYFREVHEHVAEDTQTPGPSGYLYAVATTEEPRRIKVGYTIDVEQRMRQLATMSPVELSLLATWPGSLRDEAELHEALGDYRLHGEWFEFAAWRELEPMVVMNGADSGD